MSSTIRLTSSLVVALSSAMLVRAVKEEDAPLEESKEYLIFEELSE